MFRDGEKLALKLDVFRQIYSGNVNIFAFNFQTTANLSLSASNALPKIVF